MPPLPEGEPLLKAADETAAAFLIRQVHAHPHEVTIIAAGPLTNLALAIRMDPSFASDAKALVFMGALIDTNMMAVTGNADYASDFNFIFDPEAAHITLTAPWPRMVAVGNVSNGVMMTRALMDKVAAVKTPLTDYLSKYFIDLPLWDEMAGAVALDPTLVTKSVDATMDVDLAPDVNYGHAHVWNRISRRRAWTCAPSRWCRRSIPRGSSTGSSRRRRAPQSPEANTATAGHAASGAGQMPDRSPRFARDRRVRRLGQPSPRRQCDALDLRVKPVAHAQLQPVP